MCAAPVLAHAVTSAGPELYRCRLRQLYPALLGSARLAAAQVSVKDQLAKMLVHGPDVGIEAVGATLALAGGCRLDPWYSWPKALLGSPWPLSWLPLELSPHARKLFAGRLFLS